MPAALTAACSATSTAFPERCTPRLRGSSRLSGRKLGSVSTQPCPNGNCLFRRQFHLHGSGLSKSNAGTGRGVRPPVWTEGHPPFHPSRRHFPWDHPASAGLSGAGGGNWALKVCATVFWNKTAGAYCGRYRPGSQTDPAGRTGIGTANDGGAAGGHRQTVWDTARALADLKPDTVRIYPMVILKGTPAYALWQQGDYSIFSLEEGVQLCAGLLEFFEQRQIRVIKLGFTLPGRWRSSMPAGCTIRRFGSFAKADCTGRYVFANIPMERKAGDGVRPPQGLSACIGQKRENIIWLHRQGMEIRVKPSHTLSRGKLLLCPKDVRRRSRELLLKSLELQGFKSFPDKTKITFGKGLTAVVGPNGSGKSNISDAMRWVMGSSPPKPCGAAKWRT